MRRYANLTNITYMNMNMNIASSTKTTTKSCNLILFAICPYIFMLEFKMVTLFFFVFFLNLNLHTIEIKFYFLSDQINFLLLLLLCRVIRFGVEWCRIVLNTHKKKKSYNHVGSRLQSFLLLCLLGYLKNLCMPTLCVFVFRSQNDSSFLLS